MTNKLLQININHARDGHDLMLQRMAEEDFAVAIVPEPYVVPRNHTQWHANDNQTIAITWRKSKNPLPCVPIDKGEHHVVVRWGDMITIGVYLSPNREIATVERTLEEIERCIRLHNNKAIIIGGDFNTKAGIWHSLVTNPRGTLVANWASEMGLICLNKGSRSTCIHGTGESIVDLTFANQQAAARVNKWKVSMIESASDHRYIEMTIGKTYAQRNRETRTDSKRWTIKKLNEDLLRAGIAVGSWIKENNNTPQDPENKANNLQKRVTEACEVAMPRAAPKTRRAMPWWNEELAQLREATTKTRRRIKRIRRNRQPENPVEVEEKINAYKEAKKRLSKTLRKAKALAWTEFVDTLNENPWGRPYLTVMGKLRRWAPPYTESLEENILNRVIEGLFPPPIQNSELWTESQLPEEGSSSWRDDFKVTTAELKSAVKKMTSKNAAPGPSGIPAKIWAIVIPEMAEEIKETFTDCLRKGIFPSIWKRSKLILLRKPGKPDNQSSGYRPICLLDDEAKLLERIVADRILNHLGTKGPNLNPAQYGFRRGRSTIDAILMVRQFIENAYELGHVVIGVSLDITNAFNSIPWEVIGEALKKHRVPLYLRRIIRDYLKDRLLTFTNENGKHDVREVKRGVPQGSILGPLLWNIAFNDIMKDEDLPEECKTICYADDTMVLASGKNWEDATLCVNEALDIVVHRIEERGLAVAPHKSEAAGFRDKGKMAVNTHVKIAGTHIKVGTRIRYLGLTLDSRWSFLPHFTELALRLEGAALALSRLLPNIGGPQTRVRKLYAIVVASIALYGAPVWTYHIRKNRRIISILRNSQRRMAGRIISAYRTASFATVTALANTPPLELLADKYQEVHEKVTELKEAEGTPIHPRTLTRIQEIAHRNLVKEWQKWLDRSEHGKGEAIETIGIQLQAWLQANVGLPYRTTQMLTGHGCFGRFLCRIGKENSEKCWHCDAICDSVSHTLRDCPAWTIDRETLIGIVGRDLTWDRIIKMLCKEKEREVFIAFCEKVISTKEKAERIREGIPP